MKIIELFQKKRPLLSFEIFPPKREGDLEKLFDVLKELKTENPDYVSVTYGAGGSTREKTFEIALRLKKEGFLPLVHLTCVGHSRNEIRGLLEKLQENGIENLLALRGDPPRGQEGFQPAPDGFRFASELIAFIRREGFPFCLGAAAYPEGHPEAESREADLRAVAGKVRAGADFLVTQLFFRNQDYFDFLAGLRRLGVEAPVDPGIWLLTDEKQIARICELSGATFPEDLRRELAQASGNPQEVSRRGLSFAVRQCRELLGKGAPGLHFYTMNRSAPVKRVLSELRKSGWFVSRKENGL